MTVHADTFAKVCALIASELKCSSADLSSETTAEDVDGWDSLAHARLIMALEDQLNVRFPGEKLFDLDCVGDLVSLADQALSLREEIAHDVT